ncbi:hypothetical protein D3C75_736020 [compost metagenome]
MSQCHPDNNSFCPAAQHEGNQEQCHQVRDTQKQVGDPGDHPVHHMSHACCGEPQETRDHHAGGAGGYTHLKTERKSFNGARQHIPAQPIRSEGMRQRRPKIALREVSRQPGGIYPIGGHIQQHQKQQRRGGGDP